MKRALLCLLLTLILAIVISITLNLLKIDLPSVAFFGIGVVLWMIVFVTLDPFRDL